MRVRRLARSPFVFWLATAALASLTALVVAHLVGRAEATAARYGGRRPAVVANRTLGVGDVVAPGDVAVHDVPAAFLPEGTLTTAAGAVGHTVVVAVFAGEAVLRAHVAPSGLHGVAALLPPGARAVAVPAGAAGGRLQRGDVLDVLATFDPATAGNGDPTFPVATGALVVDVAADTVTVAVTPAEANRVAFALAHGAVTLAISSPAEPPPR